MMQCQICGNLDGPFEIAEIKNGVILVCEDCAKKEGRKNGTANIRHKRHDSRVSRTNDRSER